MWLRGVPTPYTFASEKQLMTIFYCDKEDPHRNRIAEKNIDTFLLQENRGEQKGRPERGAAFCYRPAYTDNAFKK